jgi:hypothetical protein
VISNSLGYVAPMTEPLVVTLSDGQKVEAMKRFRHRYTEELTKVEAELTEALTHVAEADFLAQYLGEQPEIIELRKGKEDAERLQKRRIYLKKIIARLDEYTPQQKPITVPVPSVGTPQGAGSAAARPGGIKRY